MTIQLDRESALAFLYGRINYERTTRVPYRSPEFKLRTMRDLLARLGDPHEQLKAFHVAGTKGKGSTATLIASVLSAAGYRTGLYTSPHLDRLEQRAMIDGVEMTAEQLVGLVSIVLPIVEEMDRAAEQRGPHARGPTFFEVTTAMTMLHFAQSVVDVAVLEVGLGGRLDSTNVCRPLITVITSISFDHTKTLGNTLAAIAYEKAGIIKRGVPVVSGVVEAEPRRVIERIAADGGCRLFTLGEDFEFDYRMARGEPSARVSYGERISAVPRQWDDLSLSLLGRHQGANAAVAICTLARLQDAGWQISDEAMRQGVATARCPARIEVVRRRPTLIVDSAHNVASVEALVQTLDEHFDPRQRVLVFATSRDKDVEGMLRALLPRFDYAIFTRYVENPRAVDPEELFLLARQFLRDTRPRRPADECLSLCGDPQLAWHIACSRAEPDDLVCVSGSTFLAAEIRPLALQAEAVNVALPSAAC